jgi:hypothetical protein
MHIWNRDVCMFRETLYNYNLVLDLFILQQPVYLSQKQEANKDMLIGFAISNSNAKVK